MKFEIAPKETEIQANWDDAKLYCFALNTNNKTGWRLPTEEELDQIYRSKNDFDGNPYWSSTEYDSSYAWIRSMYNGYQFYGLKNVSYIVRAVRNL